MLRRIRSLLARTAAVPGAALLLGLSGAAGAQDYRNPALAADARVRDLLARMTLEEKFWQLYMIPGGMPDSAHPYQFGVFGVQNRAAPDARADAALNNAMQRYQRERTRLGIPMLNFEEAVHGVMRRGATVFPAAIGLAATWDSALVARVAAAMAAEAHARGIRMVLSPVVNIATDVRWGRVEETYGEDPFLSSVMGRAYVREFETRGIVTTPKHFVANVGDGGRDSYPIDVSRRLLDEVHFPPFRAAFDAGARSLMTSYNSVDGAPATQSRWLLDDILRREWGFRGFVISDQSAVGGATVLHHTEASTATATKHAIESGLDVIFQSSYEQHRPYLDAFRRGMVSATAIDSAVARVLRVKFQLGLFEHPYGGAEAEAARVNRSAEHRALAREAARSSAVLLRNANDVLPLGTGARRVAVIGAFADSVRLGGYTMDDATGVSLAQALRERLGDGNVRVVRTATPATSLVPGAGAAAPRVVPADALTGLRGEYFANIELQGDPVIARDEAAIDFRWTLNSPGRGLAFDWYSARWAGRMRVPAGGAHRVGVEGNDGYRLWIDGRLVVDNWRKQGFGRTMADVPLAPGSTHDIRLEYFESTGNARLRLVWEGPAVASADVANAEAAARASDAAVIVASVEEGEFRDRAQLSLPGNQEEIIRRVAATGTPTIVVILAGSAVTMSRWDDSVGAVLHAWYPGEEGGRAIADILFGDANPAGRLPITFPEHEGQLPLVYNHKPTGRGDDYVDLTGMPAFPFGFGLSYTTFRYSSLRIDTTHLDTGALVVRFRVTNTGTRAGDEVAQVYTRDVLASVARPVMSLSGFTRVRLGPGETRDLEVRIPVHQLRMLDAGMRWVLEPGVFRIMVGASSEDIRLRGEVSLTPRGP